MSKSTAPRVVQPTLFDPSAYAASPTAGTNGASPPPAPGHGFQPYPAYKDSGVPWLGNVPEHWGVVRSRRLFSVRTELARPDDVQLSATQAFGVILQAEFEQRVGRRVVKISMHLEKRRHVEKDDFVISMRSFQGGLERAWETGCIRSSYVVLEPGSGIDVGYFAYLFKSYGYIRALQATANFIRDGQDLNFGNFCLVDLPLLPLKEQHAIAEFLDHADRRIRRYIRAKQRLIALLNEQKQAIIHHAVTRGLDPNVRLKPSGVEWLGDVPEHWEVLRVKQCARTISKGTTPSTEGREILDYGPVRFLKAENIAGGQIVDKPSSFIDEETNAALRRSQLSKGDVLFVIAGATLGKVAVVEADVLPANTNQAIAFIRPNKRIVARYLALWLQSSHVKELTWLKAVQSAQPNLSMADLGSFPVPLPPVTEQSDILRELDEIAAGIDTAIRYTHQEIALLREYRTRLIADVVTGKLDIRAAAANLPAEADEPEPFDDTAALAEDDDTLAADPDALPKEAET